MERFVRGMLAFDNGLAGKRFKYTGYNNNNFNAQFHLIYQGNNLDWFFSFCFRFTENLNGRRSLRGDGRLPAAVYPFQWIHPGGSTITRTFLGI